MFSSILSLKFQKTFVFDLFDELKRLSEMVGLEPRGFASIQKSGDFANCRFSEVIFQTTTFPNILDIID